MKFEDCWKLICEEAMGSHGSDVVFSYIRDDGYIFEEKADKWIACQVNENEESCLEYACGTALELGCGCGKYGKYLLKNSIVTDIEFVDIGQINALFFNDNEKFICDDMLNFVLHSPQKYNTILLMRNVIAECGDISQITQLLRGCYEILNPEGHLIISFKDYRNTDKDIHLRYHCINKDNGLYPGTVRLRLSYGDILSEMKQLCYNDRDFLFSAGSEIGYKVVCMEKRGWDYCIFKK